MPSWNDDPRASNDDALVPPQPAGPPPVEPTADGRPEPGPYGAWSAHTGPAAPTSATVPPPRPTYAPVAVPPPPQYPQVPPPPGWAPPAEPAGSSRRRFLAWGSVAAVVAAGGAVAAWQLTDGDKRPAAKPQPIVSPPPPVQPTTSAVPPEVPLAETGPYTLTMWLDKVVVPGADELRLTTDLADALTKADALGTLRPQIQEFADDAKLDTALASGSSSAPDLFQTTTFGLAQRVARKELLDLTPYASRLNVDTWHPVIRAACTIDGKLYALPLAVYVPVVLYDKRLCDPAGFVVPRTRDEWLGQLDKLKAFHAATPGFQALQLVGKSWQTLVSCLYEDGSQIAVRTGERWRGTLAEQPARDAVAFFDRLQGYSNAKKDVEEWADPAGSTVDVFAAGKTAMAIQPDWIYHDIVRKAPGAAGHLAAFPIPGRRLGVPAAVGGWGDVVAVSAKTGHPAGAANLLRVLSSAPWQERWADTMLTAPAVVGVKPPKDAANPMRPATLEALRQGRPYPPAPGWTATPLKDFAKAVLADKVDPTTAGRQADSRIETDFPRTTRP